MQFILHHSPTGKLKLYPNKTHTPKDILKETKEIDIPTDKDGLLAFINEILDRIPEEPSEHIDPIDPIYEGKSDLMKQIAEEQGIPLIDVPLMMNVERVTHWILDTASNADIENTFTVLGTRFHEMRKKSS
jgi:hypothetical protein